MNKSFCILPWIHLATRPNGDVRLCCTANASGAGVSDVKDIGLVKRDGIAMNLKYHTIEEVWNCEQMKHTRLAMLNGDQIDSCRKCYEEESSGIVSKRQWETEIWRDRIDFDSVLASTGQDGSVPVQIPYFDLRLGNACQLKCVMCSPHDSSSWIKEWKIMFPSYTNANLKSDQNWDTDFDYNWYQKGSFLESMKNQSGLIKELYFAGGEPLLIPEHYRILEFMVETGSAANCVLRYNSNGLKLSDRLFNLWSYFKEVKFNFSIDALGEKNDYIRYPSRWNDIEENLHRLDETPDNITVNIACAIQILNVLSVTDLIDWKLHKNFKKINRAPYGAGLIGTHLVYLPSYLNVRVLPTEIKEQAKQKITLFCSKIQSKEFLDNPYGLQRWRGLIKYMEKKDWSNKLPQFSEYIKSLDRSRGTDFKSIFPEYSSLI